MDHLWLLTEERPKPSVVLQIIKMYCKDFDDRITLHNEIKIYMQLLGNEIRWYSDAGKRHYAGAVLAL